MDADEADAGFSDGGAVFLNAEDIWPYGNPIPD